MKRISHLCLILLCFALCAMSSAALSEEASVLELPDDLVVIRAEAFLNDTSLEKVVIPEGVTTLGDYAFAYCTNLTSATLPESLRTFGASLFDHSDNVTVYVIEGSKAHEWAKYDSVKYEVI